MLWYSLLTIGLLCGANITPTAGSSDDGLKNSVTALEEQLKDSLTPPDSLAVLPLASNSVRPGFPSTLGMKCPPKAVAHIDKLTYKLFTFGKSGRSFPERYEDFKKYCNETLELTNTLQNYVTNCVEDSFTANMLKIVFYTVRHEAKSVCKIRDNPTKRQTLLIDSAQCSNSVKGAHQKCSDRAIRYLVDSIEMTDYQKKMGYICCNVPQLDECMRNAMLRNKSKCTPARVDTSMEFLDSVRGNAISFLCSNFDTESSQCDKFYADAPKSTTSGYSFYLMPLIASLANVEARVL